MPLVTRTSKFGNIIKANDEPVAKTNGDVWVDTDDSKRGIMVADGADFNPVGLKINDTTTVSVKALI